MQDEPEELWLNGSIWLPKMRARVTPPARQCVSVDPQPDSMSPTQNLDPWFLYMLCSFATLYSLTEGDPGLLPQILIESTSELLPCWKAKHRVQLFF